MKLRISRSCSIFVADLIESIQRTILDVLVTNQLTGEGRLDADGVPDDVHPTKIESVGRYALQIHWSDGHSTGIYPFRRLRELAEAADGA